MEHVSVPAPATEDLSCCSLLLSLRDAAPAPEHWIFSSELWDLLRILLTTLGTGDKTRVESKWSYTFLFWWGTPFGEGQALFLQVKKETTAHNQTLKHVRLKAQWHFPQEMVCHAFERAFETASGAMVDTMEGRDAIQKDPARLER